MKTFIKYNPRPGTQSLVCEARGLAELKKHQSVHGLNIPQVVQEGEHQLELEFIDSADPTPLHWRRLAVGLAKLHQVIGTQFGFESSNFIGLNEQINTPSENWGEFFVHQRLKFQIELIQDNALKEKTSARLESHFQKLIQFLNQHQPKASLLHGDLWSGNVMFSEAGPWLIDPAVYYGDRETDLAMTKLFGGFAPEFYSTYESEAPLPEGAAARESIYNLYHYLNHFNLFGSSYWNEVEKGFQTIERLI